jgi:DNA replication protein DnaC
MEYIANDPKSKKIKKLALMLRNLDINIYIYGEKGTGKSYLAHFIGNGEIVENFDALNSLPKLKNRLIAVGSGKINVNSIIVVIVER